jgi:hypothetical protein
MNRMGEGDTRPRRAGEPILDLCRACKTTREHTVMAVDGSGHVVRVVCDYCRSEHNYRGGGDEPRVARPPAGSRHASGTTALVSERERTGAPMSTDESAEDLELLLRRIVREEMGLTPTAPAEKWRGGTMVLRPGKPGLQEKVWPIESLFHKIVMIRNRLRSLEQQVNASDLPEDAKLKLQAYVTGCYGTLTSFNALFAEEADQFRGSAGSD